MSAGLDSTGKRLLGFVTGLAFGVLLQRGRVARYDVIVEQLLFRNGRVLKTMASAVVVGALGIHALARKGLASKEIKPMKVGGVTIGAVLFGAGLAVSGYCPGTSVAAVGEGRRDAIATVLGMLVGAGAFVALYPRLVPVIDAGGDLGKLTLPSATRTGAPPWLGALTATSALGASALEIGSRGVVR
jgi:uncharacterized membrane protein YedE/YeeE